MKIGFSEIIITPDLESRKKPLQLGGYSPRKLCSGVHDDLFARAVYIEGNDKEIKTHILLIVCDILSTDNVLSRMVKKQISKRIPILLENILISATHTHHGPDYRGMFRPGGSLAFIIGFLFPIPQTEELIILGKKLIKLSEEAYNNKKKAKIGSTQTFIPEEERVMINRRDPFDYETANYPITVIKVVSHEEENKGKLLGIILNYACHGTVLPRENTLITADYIGYVIKELEQKFPDLKGNFVYFNGPCGEINPLSLELKEKMKIKGPNGLNYKDIYNQEGTWEDAQRIGKTIAKHAFSVLEEIKCNEYNNISILCRKIKIPIKDYPYGSDLKSVINKFLYKRKLRLFSKLAKLWIIKSNFFFNVDQLSKGYVETVIQVIDVGDVLIGTAPGEYFMKLGKEVMKYAKSKLPSKKSFVIELANETVGYLFTIEAYLEGGYESAFSIIPLGGRFITMKLKQLIDDLKGNS